MKKARKAFDIRLLAAAVFWGSPLEVMYWIAPMMTEAAMTSPTVMVNTLMNGSTYNFEGRSCRCRHCNVRLVHPHPCQLESRRRRFGLMLFKTVSSASLKSLALLGFVRSVLSTRPSAAFSTHACASLPVQLPETASVSLPMFAALQPPLALAGTFLLQ